ncbi:MAG: hypothetical protein B6D45_05975 [Ignavibacteriales bacterium UTCHB3]|nr:MAG: hypothetical protein B6D45_05975 [Ignavibacteriales bacterium UTCHB3]
MFDFIDKKYINQIRLASFAVLALVVFFVLIDYLIFRTQDEPVVVGKGEFVIQSYDTTTHELTVKLPLVFTNKLSVNFNLSEISVKVNGKEVDSLRDRDFTIGSDDSDTLFIPVTINVADLGVAKGSGGDSPASQGANSAGDVEAKVSNNTNVQVYIKTKAYYFSWILDDTVVLNNQEVVTALLKRIGGEIAKTVNNTTGNFESNKIYTATAKFLFKNPSPLPLLVNFSNLVLKVSSSKGVSLNTSKTKSETLKPGEEKEITFDITPEQLKELSDTSDHFNITGMMSVSLEGVSSKTNISITAKKPQEQKPDEKKTGNEEGQVNQEKPQQENKGNNPKPENQKKENKGNIPKPEAPKPGNKNHDTNGTKQSVKVSIQINSSGKVTGEINEVLKNSGGKKGGK